MELVLAYHGDNCKDKEILVAVDKAIKSSLELRSKKDLIEDFVASLNAQSDVRRDWPKFVAEQRDKEIERLIREESLDGEKFRAFLDYCFRDGEVKTTGTDIVEFMPPVSRFEGNRRETMKSRIIDKIQVFFEKFFGLFE